jgi:hypothetical protein
MRSAAALLAIAIGTSAHAKTFTNSYVSFELPDKWNCSLEQTEWVCSPGSPAESPQAIIILTAKEVGPSDSLPAYKAHLMTPKQITGRAGNIITSEILTVDDKKIADQPWVDGFHKSSEVPNYLTRYLATTKGRIAVLVTFSAHQLYYSKYSADFLRAIGSLRVIAPKENPNGRNGGGGDGPFGTVGAMDFAGADGLPPEGDPGSGGSKAFGNKTKAVLALAVVLAALGLYMLIKKGKKKR